MILSNLVKTQGLICIERGTFIISGSHSILLPFFQETSPETLLQVFAWEKQNLNIARMPELLAKLSPAQCPESSAALLNWGSCLSLPLPLPPGPLSGSFQGGGEEPRRGKGPQSRLRVHYHTVASPHHQTMAWPSYQLELVTVCRHAESEFLRESLKILMFPHLPGVPPPCSTLAQILHKHLVYS